MTDTDGQPSPLLAKQVTVAAYDVNSVGDGPAKDTTQPACDTGSTVVINATTVPECTLRAAIQAVDAAGRGAITFNLPTGVTPTLAPATPLPTITAANASIDASTVTGGYLKIDGTALDRTTGIGLHVSGANDTIRGMDLENVATGILVDAAGGNDTIAGSTIGDTSNTATTPVGVGISVTNSSNDLIGGLTVADRVYIDKASTGIYIGGTSTGDKVYGDYIGVDSFGGYAGDVEPVFVNSASGHFHRRAIGESRAGTREHHRRRDPLHPGCGLLGRQRLDRAGHCGLWDRGGGHRRLLQRGQQQLGPGQHHRPRQRGHGPPRVPAQRHRLLAGAPSRCRGGRASTRKHHRRDVGRRRQRDHGCGQRPGRR